SRRRHTRFSRDWSSDVCSSDLPAQHHAQDNEQELREFLELLQPGWESEVVAIRYVPEILVAYDSRSVHRQGSGPAPSPIVPEIAGLFVAGDWVGSEGRLADAALASAKSAAMAVINHE